MVEYRHNEPYYKLHFSELEEDIVKVLSFEGEEAISCLFEYRFELLSEDPELDPDSILNKKATFILTRGDEEPVKIHGIISHFEQRGRTPDYVSYYAVLVPKFWLLTLTHQSVVFQNMNVEKIVTHVLEEAGLSSSDFKFELNESYPDLEYVVQYRETDFNFINRRLEHFGIFYYFDHSDDTDVIVFTDANDNLPAIEQEEDIYYNPNKDPLSEKETISELTYQQKVVTGLVKLKEYNYRFPNKQLLVESQIDSEAPGVYYDYGDHFKDESEGDFLAKVRNEEIVAASKIFRGKSDCRLFHAGYKFTMGQHYREEWNADYILTKVISRGTQRGLFGILAKATKVLPTYENQFEAIPVEIVYRPPRITPIPRIAGIMSARMESGSGDEYAFLDDQGRYKVKVPFDLGDNSNGEASRPLRLSQPYSGPNYGIHFPNHADTEMVWACVDGNVDRPLGLGTVPNPSNSSPSTSGNKAQSVIRTAAQNELHFDDTTGSENIYLHATKDWTIDVVNDKNQTIGNNETTSIGKNQQLTVENNRAKTVRKNQTETIEVNKTINVGGNHIETIKGNMTQEVKSTKTETISLLKALTIGGAYQVTVIGAMNETVGAAKAEEIVGAKIVNVGAYSREEVVGNKNLQARNITQGANKNFTCEGKEDFGITAGKKLTLSAGDDFGLVGSKKGAIDIADELVLKCGSASITLKKDGSIILKGMNIDIDGSQKVNMKGTTVNVTADAKATVSGNLIESAAKGPHIITGKPVKLN